MDDNRSDLQPNQLEIPANIIQMATYVPFATRVSV